MAADHRKNTNRPLITLTYAQSLDGCISARPGEAIALSGRQSLTLTHRLRASHDAILVGIGTVLSDNPRLNVRLVQGADPIPIIVDGKLRLPLDCKLLKQSSRAPLIVTTAAAPDDRKAALEAAGAKVVVLPSVPSGFVDLSVMLGALAEMGVNSLMVEGGSRIITSFLMHRLPNFIVLTIAPVLVGGLRAVRDIVAVDGDGCLRLTNPQHKRLGKDLILWGELQ
jgi:3,4-dihydroxy 2-butanone 4-phosphate synthase/GTP cyclohydrolase II